MKGVLDEVFERMKSGHVYTTDKLQYKKNDHWRPELVGDCEDFALACDKELMKLGVDSGEYILCYTETDDYHMVLSVDGWILDNRQRRVKSRDDLPYKWDKVLRNGQWFRIKTNGRE